MPAIVVPFNGGGKRRLAPLPETTRASLALAMLEDVLAACALVGETFLVTSDRRARALAAELGAAVVPDEGGGQGGAVAAALGGVGVRPALVVNADLPCVRPDDLHELVRATPERGLAYVAARDGTTNALGLASSDLFATLYGRESAKRFRDHAAARAVAAASATIPNLVDDVDSLDDLKRLAPRLGPRTRAYAAAPRLAHAR